MNSPTDFVIAQCFAPDGACDDIRSEYDLSKLKGGIRGKYYEQAKAQLVRKHHLKSVKTSSSVKKTA
jgi:hypothetical protein